MANEAFTLDMATFTKKFLEYATKTAPAAAEKGMFEALSALKNDADTVSPKTPHLHGNLRGDYTFILEGITQTMVSENSGGDDPDHRESGVSPTLNPNGITSMVVFRQPYAARWHEAEAGTMHFIGRNPVHWSEAGVGPKYLESKMSMFKEKYMSIVAARVYEGTGK